MDSDIFPAGDLNDLALSFIAQTEAARDELRALYSVRGAISRAFRAAQSTKAAASQNMINGVTAAHAAALALSTEDQPEAVAALILSERDRLATLKAELTGGVVPTPDPDPEPEPEVQE